MMTNGLWGGVGEEELAYQIFLFVGGLI